MASKWTESERAVVAAQVKPPMQDHEVDAFEKTCAEYGLSPFTNQIYPQRRDGRIIFIVGINGLRVNAAKNPRYLGTTAPQWAGADGIWRDLWFGDGPPLAARVGVWMQGCPEPVYGVIHISEFKQNSPMWGRMLLNQSAKCAEAQGLRKACPELGSLYEQSEIGAEVAPLPIPQGTHSLREKFNPAKVPTRVVPDEPTPEPELRYEPVDESGIPVEETPPAPPDWSKADAAIKTIPKSLPEDVAIDLKGAAAIWEANSGWSSKANIKRAVLRAMFDRGYWNGVGAPQIANTQTFIGACLNDKFDYDKYK